MITKNNINGIVLINKPRGISSNAVANKVKWLLNAKKAGHLGTLDVEGCGLLPVTLGKSTKLFDYFLNKNKIYQAIFRFGIETDTLDLEGKIIKECQNIPTLQQVKENLKHMIGKQNQMPPQYSAKKINGKKAYDLARVGEVANLKPKEIEIYDFKLLNQINQTDFLFEINCSSGTYIRSLARDFASLLSTYSIMSYIIRTKCGVFELKDAFELNDIESNNFNLIKPESVFALPVLQLDEKQYFNFCNGVQILVDKIDGEYKVFFEKSFLGVCEIKNGDFKIKIKLA